MRRLLTVTRLVLCAMALTAGGAAAQQSQPDSEVSPTFNLSTPGARSLAMGGAFVGLADDASAAYTNPAGLTNLTVGGSEVALEFRYREFSNPVLDRGHALGEATGIGVDHFDHLVRPETTGKISGNSFLSFAFVLKGGIVVALYRHRVANFESEFETQGAFFDWPADGVITRFFPRRTRTELKIFNFGASAAYEIGRISIGLGVSRYEMDLDRVDQRFFLEVLDPAGNPAPLQLLREPGYFFGPADFTEDNAISSEIVDSKDTDVGLNVGLIWKPGSKWSVGAVYRQGPEFETMARGFQCSSDGRRPATGGLRSRFDCQDFADLAGTLRVPDVYGVGVAFRTGRLEAEAADGSGEKTYIEGKTKVTLDVNRIRYSQRIGDFTRDLPITAPDFELAATEFHISDSDQVHLGVERIYLPYGLRAEYVATVRLGAWYEPFHGLEYSGDNPFWHEVFGSAGDKDIHVSVGLGLVIKEDYQIDVAADLSDSNQGDTFSISLVKFF